MMKNLEKKINNLFESKYFQFLFFSFFAIGCITISYSSAGLEKYYLVFGGVYFIGLALFSIAPNISKKLLSWVSGLIVVSLIIASMIWGANTVLNEMGWLPISIIIGSLIIAWAIKTKQ